MVAEWIIWCVCAAFGTLSYLALVRKYPASFRSPNFRGTPIPSSAGLAFVLTVETGYACLWPFGRGPESSLLRTAFIAAVSFGLLGLADDLYGDRSVGGLRGHFSKLITQGKVTTGVVKAVGGALAALAAGVSLHLQSPQLAILSAVLIALTANAVNLTDTRPGRSLSFSIVLGAIGLLTGCAHFQFPAYAAFIFPLLFAACLYLFDRAGLLMIGDCGANAIGAVIGLLWAALTPIFAQLVFVAALIWFHWWTESHSLSRAIESSAWLKRIDRHIGVRS